MKDRKRPYQSIKTLVWSLIFYNALGLYAKDDDGRYELFAGDFKTNVQAGSADFQI